MIFLAKASLIDLRLRVLVATIRDLGTCPCPFCLVTIDDIPQLGQAVDQRTRVDKKRRESDKRIQNVESARKIIYNHGYAPGNDRSDFFLKDESLVATEASGAARFRLPRSTDKPTLS